jgi:hypothetical protein
MVHQHTNAGHKIRTQDDNICPAAAAGAPATTTGAPATATGAEQEGGHIPQEKNVIARVQPQSSVLPLHGLACQALSQPRWLECCIIYPPEKITINQRD